MNNEPPNPRFINGPPLHPVTQENQQIVQNNRTHDNVHSEIDSAAKVAAWNQYNEMRTLAAALNPEGNTPTWPPQKSFPGQQPAEFNNATGFPVNAGFPINTAIPAGSSHGMQFQSILQGQQGQPIFRENQFMNQTPIMPEVALQNAVVEATPPVDTPKVSKSDCKYQLLGTLTGHTKSIAVVKFSPCGKYLATASADKLIKIWRILDFTCEKTLCSHKLGVNDVSWSSNSQFIASGSDDTTVKIFCVLSGTCIKTLKGHTNYVFCCTFNPQSSLIVSGGYDDTLRIWDVKTGICVKCFPAHSDPITCVSFNNTGTLIASSSFEGCIRIWDASNANCLKTLVDVDHAPITYVSFTPNGKFILSSQLDSTVKLWDFQNNKAIKCYSGHVNSKYCIFANIAVPIGKEFQRVISGSEDGKIYVWDIQTKKVVQILSGHESAVLATDSHPTTNIIASGGLEPDHKVRIWALDR